MTECHDRWLTTELYCQLEVGHIGMHWSKGIWDSGGEIEMWWGQETFKEERDGKQNTVNAAQHH